MEFYAYFLLTFFYESIVLIFPFLHDAVIVLSSLVMYVTRLVSGRFSPNQAYSPLH